MDFLFSFSPKILYKKIAIKIIIIVYKLCSSPVNITVMKGLKNKTEIITEKMVKLLSVNLTIKLNIKTAVNEAKKTFKTKGRKSLIPTNKNENDKIKVQRGEDEQDVNSYLVIPHIPCFTRFLAIAM